MSQTYTPPAPITPTSTAAQFIRGDAEMGHRDDGLRGVGFMMVDVQETPDTLFSENPSNTLSRSTSLQMPSATSLNTPPESPVGPRNMLLPRPVDLSLDDENTESVESFTDETLSQPAKELSERQRVEKGCQYILQELHFDTVPQFIAAFTKQITRDDANVGHSFWFGLGFGYGLILALLLAFDFTFCSFFAAAMSFCSLVINFK
ncbi:hypothetical protein MPER_12921 [Moniliophthora perniciosa FA553]|nr:hypothetical protein MPER_12921 [Moniliophthora perniciosa FA553]